MAFIPKSMLKTEPKKRKSHDLLQATIRVTPYKSVVSTSASAWVRASAEDRYQEIGFTQADLATAVPEMIKCCTPETRQQIARTIVSEMKDGALLDFLKEALNDREKKS